MNFIKRSVLFLFILTVFTTGCRKANTPIDPLPATQTDLKVVFNNKVDGSALTIGNLAYTNASGNTYQVNLLKYYISNIKMTDKNGLETKFSNYELINEKDPLSKTIVLKDLPFNTYSKLSFCLGVDSGRNHTGVQDGDLDPANDMIWDWNTGYVFFKHEGVFKTSSDSVRSLTLHLATDPAFTPIEISLNNLNIQASGKILGINFNLNSVYDSPNKIDFNNDNFHTSTGAEEGVWISKMKANLADAFSFGNYQ